MKSSILLIAAGLVAVPAGLFAQANLSGKWETETAQAALEAQKNAPAPEEGARGGGRGRGGIQPIILDLTVDASGKISGSVTEIGNPPVLMIETGMVEGNKISWVTQPRGVTWNFDVTDDNTLTLTSRVFAGRGGGGGGRGPGAGAAPGGGGAPGGGAPGGGGGRGRGPAQPIVFHRAK